MVNEEVSWWLKSVLFSRWYTFRGFIFPLLKRRHPEGPRFHQRDEGSQYNGLLGSGDPSLRLKSGSARDDASVSDEVHVSVER